MSRTYLHVRFGCPSERLCLSSLLRVQQRLLWVALALCVATHLTLAQVRSFREERKSVKPLTTQFVKRQPRLTKPLELRKRPQPRRREIRRTMVAATARPQRGRRSSDFLPTRLLGSLSRPRMAVGRVAWLRADVLEPQAMARLVQGSKEAKEVVDLSLELLDIGALDTGKYHALVVQDPEDRRNIRGFCHLAIVHCTAAHRPGSGLGPLHSFENYVLPGFLGIPMVMNECTAIKTDILGRLSLDDAEIFKAPWLLFWGGWGRFQLTASEQENLGRYFIAGGFVFEDSYNYADRFAERAPSYLSLRNATIEALATQEVEATFQKLPNSHPVYHCYFDFDGPPIGADGSDNSIHADQVHILGYTEGVEIDGCLVALLSGKLYVHAWTFWGPGKFSSYPAWVDWDPTRAFQFAINTIIFALTQEGSITNQLMESVAY